MKRFLLILLLIILLLLFLSIEIISQSKKIDPVLDQYIQAWNTGNTELLNGIVSDTFNLRHPMKFIPETGAESLKAYLTRTKEAIPDFYLTEHDRIYAGDSTIIITWTAAGTFTSGSDDASEKNNLTLPGFSVFFYKDNILTAEWIAFSDILWAVQTGYEVKKK